MRRTILVADDSPTIRRLVTQIFADANFHIIEVNNGDAAIKSFEEVRHSVVLADIYMPGRDGYQVCEYIRNHPQLGHTPVILLVGAFDAFDEDAAKEAGATASITKPFQPSVLIDLVTSILPADAPGAESPVPESGPPAEDILQTVSTAATPVPVAEAEAVPAASEVAESEDLLGLQSIFKEEPKTVSVGAMTDQDIDRIADRVIQRLSTKVIENIAWDVVPDITEKIVREELKRNR